MKEISLGWLYDYINISNQIYVTKNFIHHIINKIFSPGEARKAFGLYLGHILRKISQPNADPACCDLVMKFLQQSASNLRTPFFFTVSCIKLYYLEFYMFFTLFIYLFIFIIYSYQVVN